MAQIRQNADDRIPVGKMAVGLGEKDLGRFVILRNTFDDVIQAFVQHRNLVSAESARSRSLRNNECVYPTSSHALSRAKSPFGSKD